MYSPYLYHWQYSDSYIVRCLPTCWNFFLKYEICICFVKKVFFLSSTDNEFDEHNPPIRIILNQLREVKCRACKTRLFYAMINRRSWDSNVEWSEIFKCIYLEKYSASWENRTYICFYYNLYANTFCSLHRWHSNHKYASE